MAEYLLRSIFLSGPYGALWFLTALLLAIPLTFVIAKCLHPLAALLLSCPFFVFLVLELGYSSLSGRSRFLEAGRLLTQDVFIWLYNGLTFGFFFCAMGMWAAYRQAVRKEEPGMSAGIGKSEKNRENRKRWGTEIGLAVCLAGLFGEAFFIRTLSLGTDYAATFFMIPLTWFLLQWLLKLPAGRADGYLFLRKSSILIFTIHYGIMELLEDIFADVGWYMENTTVQYVFVLAATLALAALIYELSTRVKLFSWMKILY